MPHPLPHPLPFSYRSIRDTDDGPLISVIDADERPHSILLNFSSVEDLEALLSALEAERAKYVEPVKLGS